MRRLYPDLWQTAQQKQFSTLTVHAYLLDRPVGNALFYNPRSSGDFAAVADLGGITHHYLSHCHEVGDGLPGVAERFDSKLCCHAGMEPYLANTMPADVYFDSPDRELHAGGVEVIHTPGHTDNSVCYRYRSPHGRTYLFPGDTLYLDHGEWATLVVSQDGGNRRDLARSLALLRTLDVDVIICSVSIGDMKIVEVTRPEWWRIIDDLMRRLAISNHQA
ncbi:MAG: metallohydrolase [Acidobacteria bacterium]|nr:metallohydrolase [Acidobacteriota bacterium]